MDPSVIVSLDNIHKTYLLGIEGVAALRLSSHPCLFLPQMNIISRLRGVSLEVYHGEWLIIYGTSGGGKTSLLNIIGTIDKPTKGDLTVCSTSKISNVSFR
jgi:putative ABC transport system ATP-binding protein